MRRSDLAITGVLIAVLGAALGAHGVSSKDAAFVATVIGPAPGPFAYLGAKHMVTGYDHLLFLVGVIFFLYRLGDVIKYVSLFTLGHSLTLLGGVLWDVRANAYLIDAVIGLSVVYKGFENIGGFDRVLGFRPDTRLAFDSYSKGTAAKDQGVFTAARAGIHGWYLKNHTAGRITVTLRSAGFYAASTEFRDGEKIQRKFPVEFGVRSPQY